LRAIEKVIIVTSSEEEFVAEEGDISDEAVEAVEAVETTSEKRGNHTENENNDSTL
jgi:hypothetical protein